MVDLIPSVTLDTSTFPEQQRFEIFRATLSATHEVSRVDDDTRPFLARVTAWSLGDVIVTAGEMMANVFDRTAQRAQADTIDHFTFILLRSGHAVYETGMTTAVGPGQLSCFDFSRATRSVTSDNTTVTVAVARKALMAALSPLPDLHGALLSDVPGQLVADHFLALARYLPVMPAADAGTVAAATIALLVASLTKLPAMPAAIDAGLGTRAERYIETHLQSPALMPESICAALSVSRSNLYRAFQARGGISAYIQLRRLETLHMMLNDQNETRSLAELAAAFGFVSYTHFSASFRRRFGFSPREIRSSASARQMPDHNVVESDVSAAYVSWMHRIGIQA